MKKLLALVFLALLLAGGTAEVFCEEQVTSGSDISDLSSETSSPDGYIEPYGGDWGGGGGPAPG